MTNRAARGALCWTAFSALAWAPGCGETLGTPRPAIRAEPAVASEPAALRPPVALVGSQPIGWDAIAPSLLEASGRTVVEEAALDLLLTRELARRGIAPGVADIDAEQDALLDELAMTGDEGSRVAVLSQIRSARGLGPVRYRALLRRNAGLRALVRDASEPSDAELTLARSIAFGIAVRARLFVGATERDAGVCRAATMDASPDARPWVFAARCAGSSVHPTAPAGGLVERMSPDDPAYPDVLRDAVRNAAVGEPSPVLITPAGAAVVLVEAEIPARTPTPEETARVDHRVRVRKERLAMESLARELLERAGITPTDPDLARAWRER